VTDSDVAAAPTSAPSVATEEKRREGQARMMDVIIVVSNGALKHIRPCLASLREHPLTTAGMTVHVVDNASTDGTAAVIAREFGEVHLERLTWNSGFCIANNILLARTTAPYALVLNPDTVMFEGTLDRMVELMEQRPDIGVAGCRLIQPDGTFDHAAKRSFPTPLGALAHFTGLGRRAGAGRALGQYRATELGEHDCGEVDAVNGAFMVVRRSAMEEVGLMDETYWLYMDDLDWCYRFKRRGWKVWYEGAVTAIHVKGGTTVEARRRGRHRGLRHNLAFHRGMGRFYRKFYAGRRPLVDVVIYLAIGAKFLFSATRSTIARRSLR
jgi:N-acetylglucosaminyl-diphospho-decaprenol L-rhamnosyltransferase